MICYIFGKHHVSYRRVKVSNWRSSPNNWNIIKSQDITSSTSDNEKKQGLFSNFHSILLYGCKYFKHLGNRTANPIPWVKHDVIVTLCNHWRDSINVWKLIEDIHIMLQWAYFNRLKTIWNGYTQTNCLGKNRNAYSRWNSRK